MIIPTLSSPHDYVGLYVFDFGGHVAVGYTAEEIGVLQRAPAYGECNAYQIHSVDEQGRIALKGVGDLDLSSDHAIIFAHRTPQDADSTYDGLTDSADAEPVGAVVRMERAYHERCSPEHVVVLSYKAHTMFAVSDWLRRIDFNGGSHVLAGTEELELYRETVAKPEKSTYLRTCVDVTSRTADAVLASVDQRVQR